MSKSMWMVVIGSILLSGAAVWGSTRCEAPAPVAYRDTRGGGGKASIGLADTRGGGGKASLGLADTRGGGGKASGV